MYATYFSRLKEGSIDVRLNWKNQGSCKDRVYEILALARWLVWELDDRASREEKIHEIIKVFIHSHPERHSNYRNLHDLLALGSTSSWHILIFLLRKALLHPYLACPLDSPSWYLTKSRNALKKQPTFQVRKSRSREQAQQWIETIKKQINKTIVKIAPKVMLL